jgi:mannose-6-phosphate isomerase-like protein (cupin superfamily)
LVFALVAHRRQAGQFDAPAGSDAVTAYLRDLERAASENVDFRRVLCTTALLQVCVMCLNPHEELGSRLNDTDHFFAIMQGGGHAVLEGVRCTVGAGSGFLSPAGTTYNIVNTGAVPIKLWEVVAPPRYRQGAVHVRRYDEQAEDDPFALGFDKNLPSRDAQANWLFGLLALHGLGLPLDAAQASQRFERARRLGHPLAAAGLAWCAMSGQDCLSKAPAARTWIVAFEAARPARALYLDWLLDQRLGTAGFARAAVGDGKLRRAAMAGDSQALLEIGLQSARRGELKRALRYFQLAAPRSPAAAANVTVIGDYLRARSQAFHQSAPPLQQDPTPVYDLLPERWRLIGAAVAARTVATAIELS